MLASSFDGIPLTRQTDDHADRGRGERGGGDCYSTYRRGEGWSGWAGYGFVNWLKHTYTHTNTRKCKFTGARKYSNVVECESQLQLYSEKQTSFQDVMHCLSGCSKGAENRVQDYLVNRQSNQRMFSSLVNDESTLRLLLLNQVWL